KQLYTAEERSVGFDDGRTARRLASDRPACLSPTYLMCGKDGRRTMNLSDVHRAPSVLLYVACPENHTSVGR
ncbi:hypothetical protein, partial [Prevotella multiformis]|uniref:hypothetical protein n=1 Tax=Prevotella multiformis TaxID=282402 RepID=UPI0023EFA0BB